MDPNNKYTKMQQDSYNNSANYWNLNDKDHVVGFFDQHNTWEDYDIYLFKNIDTTSKIALDFGCGPGRNIVKFNNRFSRIDGVDISQTNLDNAIIWCKQNNVNAPILFKNNGIDLSIIDSEVYDIVFSTICLQHICVYDIRKQFLKDFFRVLKSGGSICLQMGFGKGHPNSVGYYENYYDAEGTNSFCDTRIDDVNELQKDLEEIGFIDFEYDIRPVGPGDRHGNWIFFRAKKVV